MTSVHGHCDPRFERLRAQFEESFAEGGEIGAGVSVYLDGEPVVDLWGGSADAAGTRPCRHPHNRGHGANRSRHLIP